MQTARLGLAKAGVAVLVAGVAAPSAVLALRSSEPKVTTSKASVVAVRVRRTLPVRASRSGVTRLPIRQVAAARPAPAVLGEGATYRGIVSWYGPGFHGRRAASGERFDSGAMTAAHRWLPFGTRLRVCRRSLCTVVRINDRGPYIRPRILDLSRAAAQEIGMLGAGTSYATLTVLLPRGSAKARTALRAAPKPRPKRPVAAPARTSADPSWTRPVVRSGTVLTRTVSTSRPAVSPALTPVRSVTAGSTGWGDAAVGAFLVALLAGPPASALARCRRRAA